MKTAALGAALLSLTTAASALPPARPAVAQQRSSRPPQAGRNPGDPLPFGRFGTVYLVRSTPRPSHVVLFVSGDGGWNLGVVDMAHELASLDALVIGIDIRTLIRNLGASPEACVYPAADFEELSQYVQKRLDFPRYVSPVLVGYSSGATLVYALLVQAPPGTFAGAMSLGFCPDLALAKPMCQGAGALRSVPDPKAHGVIFGAVERVAAPWVVFQGSIDQVCDPPSTERWVGSIGNARVVVLPRVGHGFSVPRNWLPQFRDEFATLVQPPARDPRPLPSPPAAAPVAAPDVSDLPLVEVPSRNRRGDTFAVMVSGDGGWAGIDRSLADALAADGIPVVGLDSLQYFWHRKTPEQAATDLQRVVEHYAVTWSAPSVIAIGYSRGADVLPFMLARASREVRDRVREVALLGLEPTVGFEFHVVDLVRNGARDELPVRPEIEKLAGMRILCFAGEDERDTLCPSLPPTLATLVRMPGGHHFNGRYQEIAARILAARE